MGGLVLVQLSIYLYCSIGVNLNKLSLNLCSLSCFLCFRHYCTHCIHRSGFSWKPGQYFCHVCTSQSAFFADPAHGAYGQARRYLETAWIRSLRSQQGILNAILWQKNSKWAQVMTLRVSFHVEADMWPHNQPFFPAPLGLKLHPRAAAKPHASSVLSYPPFSGEIRGPRNESLWSI